MREVPAFIAFLRDNGAIFHTDTLRVPDRFVAPYSSFLLDRTPRPQPEPPLNYRKDEYPAG